MIKGAIFDVDGTILDSMPFWHNVGRQYVESLGINPEDGLSDKVFALSLNDGAKFINEHYGLNKTKEEIISGITNIVADSYRNEIPLKGGAGQFLKKLHAANIPMCVATAGDASYLEETFKRLEIDGIFRGIFTCTQFDTNKNEPYIYLKAAECLGCNINEIYVFEDAYNAAKTAKDAGFNVVGVYDRTYDKFSEELKKISDIFIRDFYDDRLNCL